MHKILRFERENIEVRENRTVSNKIKAKGDDIRSNNGKLFSLQHLLTDVQKQQQYSEMQKPYVITSQQPIRNSLASTDRSSTMT